MDLLQIRKIGIVWEFFQQYELNIMWQNSKFYHHQKKTIWLCKFVSGIDGFCWCGTTPFRSPKSQHRVNKGSQRRSQFETSCFCHPLVLISQFYYYYYNNTQKQMVLLVFLTWEIKNTQKQMVLLVLLVSAHTHIK